jgi:hypothetical protein
MTVQTNRSGRSASNISSSVQKRKTLYLSSDDPRAQNDVFKGSYASKYYADIIVLSPEAYKNLLKTQVGLQYTPDGLPIAGSDPGQSDEGKLVSNLHAPTNLYWDYSDNSSTEFNANSGSNSVNITITFDPSVDDVVTDSTNIRYDYTITNVTGQNAGAIGTGSTANTFNPVKSITIVNATSSQIQISFPNISDATGYNLTVTGKNLAAGQLSKTYHSVPTPKATTHYITVRPVATKSFTGAYKLDLSVQYTKGVSGVVSKNVTI